MKTSSKKPQNRRDVLQSRGMSSLPAARPAPAGNLRGLLVTLGFAAALAGGSLFHVWTRSERLRLGYDIAAQDTRVRAADSEKDRLTLEVASLSAPSRIASIAKDRLGLRIPDPGQVIDLAPAVVPDEPAVSTVAQR